MYIAALKLQLLHSPCQASTAHHDVLQTEGMCPTCQAVPISVCLLAGKNDSIRGANSAPVLWAGVGAVLQADLVPNSCDITGHDLLGVKYQLLLA